jgi:hypothetical protein
MQGRITTLHIIDDVVFSRISAPLTEVVEEICPWIGDTSRLAAMKIQSSFSLSEILDLQYLKSKKQKKFVTDALLKNLVLHGHLRVAKMLACGVGYQKMNVAHSNVVLLAIVHVYLSKIWEIITN